MGSGLKRHFSKDIQMDTDGQQVNENYSTSLITRETQITPTMSYPFTPVRTAMIKRQRNKVLVRIWRKGNLSALLVRI